MTWRGSLATVLAALARRVPALRRGLWHLDRIAYLRAIGVQVGARCRIYSKAFGSDPFLVQLGEHVHVGTGVQFITHDGGVWVLRELLRKPRLDFHAPITVGSNVFIGNGAIIMPGVTIGDNVVIGAGSVVVRSIESNSVAAGVPARVIKSMDEYIAKASRCVETKGLAPSQRMQVILQEAMK